MILTGTPSRVSQSASVNPVGPAPTMSTPRFDDVLAICDLFVCGPYARDTRVKLSRSKKKGLRRERAKRALLCAAPLHYAVVGLLGFAIKHNLIEA